MTIKVTTSGNGRFKTLNQSDYILSYSIDESATPLAISDSEGEIPSLSVTGESNSDSAVGTLRPNSLLMIDNTITMNDDLRGEFKGRVTSVSISDGVVSVSALSILDKLNGKMRMSPTYGNLKQIYEYYFTQAGMSSGEFSVDSALASSGNLAVPGWNDTIWTKLKSLSAITKNEMYFDKDKIIVKPIAQKTFAIKNMSDESYSVELGDRTKSFKVNRNKTKLVEDVIVFAYKQGDSTESVDYNEKKEVVLTSTVSLSSVNQPEYAATVFNTYVNWAGKDSVGTTPTEYLDGFYTFRNKDGSIVPKASAEKFGAGVIAELGEADNEIKLTITGPNLKYKTPWTLEFRDDYPSLGLTGSGVMVDSSSYEFNTGSENGDEVTEYSDVPFLINDSFLRSAAYEAAKDLCGPTVVLSFSTDKIVEASNQEFGFLPGAIFSHNGSKYRVRSASYDYESIKITATQYVTFADFNSIWTGKTYTEFNDVMLTPEQSATDYMKYSDHAILPLMGP